MGDNVKIVDFGMDNRLKKIAEQGFTDSGEHILEGIKESHEEGKKRCIAQLQAIADEYGVIDSAARKLLKEKKEAAHFNAKGRL